MLPHSGNPPPYTLPKSQGKTDHFSSGEFGVLAKQYLIVMPVLKVYKGRVEIGKVIPLLTSTKFLLVDLDCILFSFLFFPSFFVSDNLSGIILLCFDPQNNPVSVDLVRERISF